MSKRRWTSWYPRGWRNRYGEEYEQLLDDLAAEQQLTWRSEVDIAQTGLALRRVYPARRRALTFGFALVLAIGAFAIGFGVRGSTTEQVGVVATGPLARSCAVATPKVRSVTPKAPLSRAAAEAGALGSALRHASSLPKKAGRQQVVTVIGPAADLPVALAPLCAVPRGQVIPVGHLGTSFVVVPSMTLHPSA